MVTAAEAQLMQGLAPVTSTLRAHYCCDRYDARPRDAHRTPGESAAGPRSMTEPRTSRYAPAAHDQFPHSTARISADISLAVTLIVGRES